MHLKPAQKLIEPRFLLLTTDQIAENPPRGNVVYDTYDRLQGDYLKLILVARPKPTNPATTSRIAFSVNEAAIEAN